MPSCLNGNGHHIERLEMGQEVWLGGIVFALEAPGPGFSQQPPPTQGGKIGAGKVKNSRGAH